MTRPDILPDKLNNQNNDNSAHASIAQLEQPLIMTWRMSSSLTRLDPMTENYLPLYRHNYI